ncbi:MAG: asparaginase [Candidatus Aenigmarchaeota archaeon]|nr:asparaginase [Candidatus Aenigmarchaeota archaeon]
MSNSIYVPRHEGRKKVILGLGGTISMEEWGRVLDFHGRVIYKEPITGWRWMNDAERRVYQNGLLARCTDPKKAAAEIVNDPYYSAREVHERVGEAVEKRYKGGNLAKMRKILHGSDIEFREVELEPGSQRPGIDSSNMELEYCKKLSEIAFAYTTNPRQSERRAVGALQGTDTEDQTLKILSFMLHGMQIPFVGTGAMSIIKDPRTDALANYRGLLVALDYDLPFPMWIFDQKLMGYRLMKQPKGNDYEFVPNDLLFATNKNGTLDFTEGDEKAQELLEKQLNLRESLFRDGPEIYSDYKYAEQAHMRLSYRPEEVREWLTRKEPTMHAVIAGYPKGNIPTKVTDAIREFTEAGGTIMVLPEEGSGVQGRQGGYGVGADALNAGAISSYGMPLKLAWAKMCWAAGQTSVREELIKLLRCPFIGETDENVPLEVGYEILRRRKKEREANVKDKDIFETPLDYLGRQLQNAF